MGTGALVKEKPESVTVKDLCVVKFVSIASDGTGCLSADGVICDECAATLVDDQAGRPKVVLVNGYWIFFYSKRCSRQRDVASAMKASGVL